MITLSVYFGQALIVASTPLSVLLNALLLPHHHSSSRTKCARLTIAGVLVQNIVRVFGYAT